MDDGAGDIAPAQTDGRRPAQADDHSGGDNARYALAELQALFKLHGRGLFLEFF